MSFYSAGGPDLVRERLDADAAHAAASPTPRGSVTSRSSARF